jgi:hypothetical protein
MLHPGLQPGFHTDRRLNLFGMSKSWRIQVRRCRSHDGG